MSEDLISKFKAYLLEQNTAGAISLASDEKFTSDISSNPWDILPVVIQHINGKLKKTQPKLFDDYKNILDIVTEKCQADDVLLICIASIDDAVDDLMFITLLDPLQKAIFRLILKKRVSYLEWAFGAINLYLRSLPIPQNLNLEGEEKLLMDVDSAVVRITDIYYELLPFCCELSMVIKENDLSDWKIALKKFILQLLGKPLAYLDMDCENKPKSKARLVAENLILEIADLSSDLYEFMNNHELSDENSSLNLADALFYYMLFCEEKCLDRIVFVYEPIYIFQNCLKFVVEFLQHDNQFAIEKAIKLSAYLLTIVGKNLSHNLLDSDIHCKFCCSIANIIIYSPLIEYRQSCLKLFDTYLYKFDSHGRYLLIYNISCSIKNANLIGYIISAYKSMLTEQFDTKQEQISEYFTGTKLIAVLNMFCNLPKGECTDLIKYADQIIATLNLLRYLAMRDKNNVTGIWNHFKELDTRYFEPLHNGLTLSIAHYNLKKNEVMAENANGDKSENSKVSVTIGGSDLPQLSSSEKLEVLNFSLTSFDMIQFLLSTLKECIESGCKVPNN